MDVYLLLKSSDFVTHDFSVERVFEGCNTDDALNYELELVLRKWYPIDRSLEVRCFVRNDVLLGQSGLFLFTNVIRSNQPVPQVSAKGTQTSTITW